MLVLYNKLLLRRDATIVSKSPSETTDCPQTFIVKTLIIENTHGHHIYMKQKEGASVQVSGETGSESGRLAAN
jgi:hypothetical protein